MDNDYKDKDIDNNSVKSYETDIYPDPPVTEYNIDDKDFDPTTTSKFIYNQQESESAKGVYLHSCGDNIFQTTSGKIALPLTADSDTGDTVAIVKLSRGVSYRRFTIDAERVGSWPDIPEPVETYTEGSESDQITATLMKVIETPYPPAIGPNGKQIIYRVAVTYVYALSRALKTTDSTYVGLLPHTAVQPSEAIFDRSTAYQERLTMQPPQE